MSGSHAGPSPGAATGPEVVTTELVAVVVAVRHGVPEVLTRRTDDGAALPSGPLRTGHRSLQAATREWVETQTGLRLGHVEQLYTFADRDRVDAAHRVISVTYLGLTRDTGAAGGQEAGWTSWYEHFPWEDRRHGAGDAAGSALVGALMDWAAADPDQADARRARCGATFGLAGADWLPDLCLQRYELLWEAGLVAEALRAEPPGSASGGLAPSLDPLAGEPTISGVPLPHDHRRILATGMARLRATIQYRPVVFELLPDAFTLSELQACVEAVAGERLHTQNFRRLIQQQELVEETGEVDASTGGRPARLFRFRRQVHALRRLVGTKLPLPRRR